jgi:hypothetical protein
VSNSYLNIYSKMGFKPYSSLSKEEKREIGVVHYGSLFNIFKLWWRKLENGLWDWVDPKTVEEEKD